MKLQINNLAALERLIGGETELELEIRNNIVQEFTRKHLKPLVNEPKFEQLTNTLKKEAYDAALVGVGKVVGNHWNQRIELDPDVKAKIASMARDHAADAIREGVRSAVESARATYTDEYISRQVDRLVKDAIDTKVKAGVEARLAQLSTLLKQ